MSNKIFNTSDGLVDLPELFSSLVDSIGSRQVIDPITKEDSLWKFVESQTRDADFIRISQLTEHSKIDGQSLAKYLKNQFDRSSSFDRTFRTALRLQGTPLEKDFFTELMKELSGYTLQNMGKMPSSFTEKRLSDLYLRLKVSKTELSPAMSELLLYSLNKKKMHQ